MTRNTRTTAQTAAERRETVRTWRRIAAGAIGFNGVAIAAYFCGARGALWPFVVGLIAGVVAYGYALWCEHVR